MKSLSEIVDEIDPTEIEPEPSLESANAYRGEDVELNEEQKAAIDRITGDDE